MKKPTLLITVGIVLILVSVIMTPVTGSTDTIYKYYVYEIDEEDIEREAMTIEEYHNLSNNEQEKFTTMYDGDEIQTTDRQLPISVDVVKHNDYYYMVDISEIREPAIIRSEMQYGLGMVGLVVAGLGLYQKF